MPKVRYRFQARGSPRWPERAMAAIRNFNDGGPKPPKQNRRPKAPAMRFFETAKRPQELAFNTVTARRFFDQHEMSLHTATRRSLPYEMVPILQGSNPRD